MQAGDLNVTDSVFEDCGVNNHHGVASGGGVHIGSGHANLTRTTFRNTWASSSNDRAYGGGLSILLFPRVSSDSPSFEHTWAHTSDHDAFGGGIGMRGGQVELRSSRFYNTTASSASSRGSVWGGGLGLNGGRARVYYSDFEDCVLNSGEKVEVGSGGAGIGVKGTAFSNDAQLFNVTTSTALERIARDCPLRRAWLINQSHQPRRESCRELQRRTIPHV